MNDAELVALSRTGDIDAFNRLVERHQGQVYNLAFRMLGDRGAAEDATQEAFFAAWRAIRSLRGANFRSWLLRIAVNACYDALRKRQRPRAASLEQLAEAEVSPLEVADPSETPEQYAERRELAHLIQRGLASLPPDQRAAVVLSDVQGFTYEEIADITRANLGTVKSRLSRGRAALRDFLTQYRELLPGKARLTNRG